MGERMSFLETFVIFDLVEEGFLCADTHNCFQIVKSHLAVALFHPKTRHDLCHYFLKAGVSQV